MPDPLPRFLALVDRRTGERLDPRRTLAVVQNSWLSPRDIAEARQTAETGSDEECVALLARLEQRARSGIEMWRFSQ